MPSLAQTGRLLLAFLVACGLGSTAFPADSRFSFVNVTEAAGIRFLHRNSPTPEKFVVETMGSGCAFLDYDADGYLDIFLVNGGPTPGSDPNGSFDHALFRNRGDGTFEDVTEGAGIRPNRSFGMGVAVADYDNDGFVDLFVTHFGGPDLLYRNRGNGTFLDVTGAAGMREDNEWSASAAFLDYDNDGDLDLYITHYLDYSFQKNEICGHGQIKTYCSPDTYGGVADILYQNNGDGTFQDQSREAGISLPRGKGLGVVPLDFDRDGLVDIYIANDRVDNFLFRNLGDGTFSEMGLLAGVALDEHGEPQSGMGTVAGDYDSDGILDLAVTNLDLEYLALYRNRGDGFFEDMSSRTGLQVPTRPFVGFGLVLADLDNDTDLDLFVANGHILDNASAVRADAVYRQPKLLLENTGGRFQDVTVQSGGQLTVPRVSRGLAVGDYDNDGDLDLLINNCGGSPELLRNEEPNHHSWVELQLVGKSSNRDGYGALVTVQAGNKRLLRQVTSAGSYLSSSDPRLHFGLGNHRGPVEISIVWPGGTQDRLQNVQPGRLLAVKEGSSAAPSSPSNTP